MPVSICDNVLYHMSLGEGVKERLSDFSWIVKRRYQQVAIRQSLAYGCEVELRTATAAVASRNELIWQVRHAECTRRHSFGH
jgi:hypothetical protein